MDARRIIAALRDGETPSAEDISWFAKGLAEGYVSDAQAGAFAMAVLLNGLGEAGRVALTRAMRDSGRVLSWDLPGPAIDKHSTGGVGDCVSLVLAPMLAACGGYVPMISGRGLGHTGGTLDKMEAIPGLSTEVSETAFRAVTAEAGCAIVAASHDIAPADRRLYAIRDVTATVESLDLITASILSKKLAAGLDALVLDVKCGSGAFMKTADDARALARALVSTANAAGCATEALLTDMSQPLAPALGNALEVAESMKVLTGQTRGRLAELSIALGAGLLVQAGLAGSAEEGARKLDEALSSGAAAERFGRMVARMGGPVQFVDDWQRFLPEANVILEVTAPEAGVVTAMAGEALGLAVVELGGGRQVEGDRIDPSVGLSDMVRTGQKVEKGQVLARVHAARLETAEAAVDQVRAAISLGGTAPEALPLVLERITG
ncbi:thymidine phosphorylase [Pseudooceanicola antarcticus]|uniref:Thymidine phosphorylase n=1 Tax=Pseudooceanicola antarcticus TaxID=1247613 RepID=A0A285IL87_9RHOB|nr:thymidine phosphorylase [Pseudooceanicola antarcticus]PJE28612.1 thymidine phosphorylase [Pseudooceanicola antarcticus]SNY48770.1 thymidine phosphorylase [Pseudooceanicola antarcticus]